MGGDILSMNAICLSSNIEQVNIERVFCGPKTALMVTLSVRSLNPPPAQTPASTGMIFLAFVLLAWGLGGR